MCLVIGWVKLGFACGGLMRVGTHVREGNLALVGTSNVG